MMDTELTVTFKAYVQKSGGEKPEIRYFNIDRGVETNFIYLQAKLQEVFPCLAEKSFVVSWIDNEHDHVVISTDQELIFALSNMGYMLKKLYVTVNESNADGEIHVNLRQSPSRKRSSGSDPEHCNVICDVCNGPVFGFRYKCLACPDFDLCSFCEANGNHPEHLVLRIPKPNIRCDLSGARYAEWFGLPNLFENEEPATGKRRCKERRSGHKEKCEEERGERKSKSGCHEKKHDRHSHWRKHFPKSCLSQNPEAWINSFTSFVNEFTNLAGNIDLSSRPQTTPRSERSQQRETDGNEPIIIPDQEIDMDLRFGPYNVEIRRKYSRKHKSRSDGYVNLEKSQNGDSSGNSDENLPPADGTNVEGDKQTDGAQADENIPSTSKSHAKKSSSKQSVASDNGSIIISIQDNDEKEPSDDDSCVFDCVLEKPSNENNERGGDEWTMLNKDDSDPTVPSTSSSKPAESNETDMERIIREFQRHMEVCSKTKQSSTQKENIENELSDTNEERRFILVEESDSATSSISNSATANAGVSTVNAGVSTVNAGAPTANAGATTVNADASTVNAGPSNVNAGVPNFFNSGAPTVNADSSTANVRFFTPPRATTRPSAPPPQHVPKERHIALALEQMMAMGFSNEDGWLTQLLESGNGNINKVLDILSSVRK